MLKSSSGLSGKLWEKRGLIGSSLLFLVLIVAGLLAYRYRAVTEKSLAYRSQKVTVSAKASPPTVEVQKGEIKKTLLLDGELRAVKSRTIFASTDEQAKI